jgi:hypothetical protein
VSASTSTAMLATIDGRSPPRPPDGAVETLPGTCLDATKGKVSERPGDWATLPVFVAGLPGCGTYPRIGAPVRAGPSEGIDRYPIHVVPFKFPAPGSLLWNINLCRALSPITASRPTGRASPTSGSTPRAPPSPASSASAS